MRNVQKFWWMAATALLLAMACGKPVVKEGEAPLPLNKFDDPTIVRIYDLADRREADSLRPYLSDSSGAIRREAALVFGSVQDSAARLPLEGLLSDPQAAAAAAWALGQLGDSLAAPALLTALQQTKDAATRNMVGEALGKCAGTSTFETILDNWSDGQLPRGSELAVAQALYRAGLRKRVPAGAQAAALSMLGDKNKDVQLYAGAFLGRVAESGKIQDPTFFLDQWTKLASADARQQLVRAFARCEDTACTRALRAVASDVKEAAATRANAFRSAGNFHDLHAAAVIALQDPQLQVHNAAADYLAAHPAGTADSTLAMIAKVSAWRPRATLLKLAMQQAVASKQKDAPAKVAAVIDSLILKASTYEHAALLTALGPDPTQHPRLIDATLKNTPVISIYAFESYLGYYSGKKTGQEAVVAAIGRVLRVKDVGLAAMGAEYIAAADPAALRGIKSTEFLDSALTWMKLPADIESYNAVLAAKGALTGEKPERKELDFQHPIDWALVKRIPTGQQAEIETSRGKIVLNLRVEDAPGTVANFVKLVQSGFYSKKRLHRVVPAFVAQGGCPRGDGWGSTPETIRSEWAPLHYSPGAVGMASAGKDTESCQWFITHCSVPHLDGRYTIFAYVASGQDVVDALEIGDEIVEIRLPGL